MPNIKSAIKRVNTTHTAEARNISQKNEMRTAVKRAHSAIEAGADNKADLLSFALKKVDKAAQRNLIHTNKAARIKSSLMTAAK
ncbi:30S ribosomal protein S20 [Staphylococcus xylosus]|uniref:Small ribosomal subunit protein bS20 n=1 Tax=Staphylococcus xylosus TaxID=1288 RepID=A0AAQ0M198_STAXY|nr:30S ribosomal protein S20 [Staphylococcus xylosus]MCM3517688.1 30S ribosomal protein S20 [Staphylococcus xylosus]MCQ3815701.1 30S ribosomal protein S20 [Staphylococcus xylosus]MCQ3818404.1 30S ribosomal protein S20 [Staphylococcus xylosus]PKI05556.1 30S ribosomal protein S20 [Staphylococcus xylosus]PTH97715.1 30S ribosomal protein S20 [Staphylococcus xylosus]